MRLLVMFDLPTITAKDRREYRVFRKYLISNGFYMMQESIYCKLVVNPMLSYAVIEKLKRHKPSNGLVQVLTVTEKQFQKMECIVGVENKEMVDTTERIVIL